MNVDIETVSQLVDRTSNTTPDNDDIASSSGTNRIV
jgi:hypothetical protein